jgi:TonB family protein
MRVHRLVGLFVLLMSCGRSDETVLADPPPRGEVNPHALRPGSPQLAGGPPATTRAPGAQMPAEAVRDAVQSHLKEVRSCYERELAQHPTLEGKVEVAVTVDVDGSVSSAEAVRSSLSGRAVGDCLAARVRTWTFPPSKAGQAAQLTLPFTFNESR